MQLVVIGLALLTGSAQSPEGGKPAPLPEGLAARVNSVEISVEDYLQYLFEIHGKRPLQDLVYGVLLDQEAGKLEISVSEEELDEVQAQFFSSLLTRHRGSEESLRAELGTQGHDLEGYLALYRANQRREILARRICERTRVLDEEQIQLRFERDYGVGGVHVEVRHIMFKLPTFRRELAGKQVEVARISDAELARSMRKHAEDLLDRLTRGSDFETLAREHSHDISVRVNGGLIPQYNYRRYGPELAEAVRAAQVGVPFGPVQTQAGLHLVEVVSRKTSQLEDVRGEIEAALMAEPATGNELRDLETRLRSAATIQTF